jgi:hypothetical protein
MKLCSTSVVLVALVTLIMFTTECAQPKTNLKPAPAALRVTPSQTQPSPESKLDQHLADLKKRLPSKEFSIVVEPPFVVVGDEPAQVVKERSEETVRWAVDRLKKDYFTKDPDEILDVWLFKDSVSYVNHTQMLWGERPGTPYGYYSREHKALIMNISTGGGTLVHELVHPFIEANFPACPPWLNEGLGSLYEKCGEEDGHIHGYVNWRLAGLQRTIKTGSLPSFKELMAMDTGTFYADKTGNNYAQARYLCYYLQQKGLLLKFYKRFHTNQEDDPTGYKSLQAVLQQTNLDRFQRRWERYVLGLSEGYEVRVE